MGILDGLRPGPRLRINNGTSIDPLIAPAIPNINLSFGRSIMPQLKASGLEDLPNQLQSLVSKAEFGKYKFTFSQQESLLNPKVVSGADVIRNTPVYLAGNEGIRQAGFPSFLETQSGHSISVGPDIRMKLDSLAISENLPTLSSFNRQTQIENFVHIDPTVWGAKVGELNDVVFHELGHAVSSQAGRTGVTNDLMYQRLGLIDQHFSAGTVPGSTLAVGQPIHINTVADYLGETLGATLKQRGIEESRADTMAMVARAMNGDAKYLLKPITGTDEQAATWQRLWQGGELSPTSGYHNSGSFLSMYAPPFRQYVDGADANGSLAVPKLSAGASTIDVFHDNALAIFERHPQWHTISDEQKSKLMARVGTVGEARAKAAYLAHLAAPEAMEESAALSMQIGLQTNVQNFDSQGINFLQMFREEAENAGGLNATMLTAESADQTIVAKSFGTWMKRIISSANAAERKKAPIGSISSIKGIRGVGKASRDGGSYAITESLRAVGKAGEAAPRSAVMTATTLERMLESAATALKVVRKV